MQKLLISLFTALSIANACAADMVIKEGVNYTVISAVSKPLPVKPGKVNVTEFFSYGCIHCSLLEPTLDKWYAGTKNVDLNRVQTVWENNFAGFAKINATVQLLSSNKDFNPSVFNQAVFNATMTQHKNLDDVKNLQDFLNNNKNLVDPKKFMATYNSFAVSTKPQEYAQYTEAYNITGTPTFIVGHKYVTRPAQPEQLIQVIQALVDKAKKEHKIK